MPMSSRVTRVELPGRAPSGSTRAGDSWLAGPRGPAGTRGSVSALSGTTIAGAPFGRATALMLLAGAVTAKPPLIRAMEGSAAQTRRQGSVIVRVRLCFAIPFSLVGARLGRLRVRKTSRNGTGHETSPDPRVTAAKWFNAHIQMIYEWGSDVSSAGSDEGAGFIVRVITAVAVGALTATAIGGCSSCLLYTSDAADD